jgi:hypothetical protein
MVSLWFIRGHVVICGLGEKGHLLAEGFRDRAQDTSDWNVCVKCMTKFRPVPSRTPPPPPTPTPARDHATLETALPGHWVTESGITNFSIGLGIAQKWLYVDGKQ